MWRPINEQDLLLKLSGPELDGFRSSALEASPAQADPVAGVILQVVQTCRGFISRNQSNLPMGAPGTIPETLIGPAVDLIVLAIMSRAAGIVLDPEGQRRKNAEHANQIFMQVAKAEIILEKAMTDQDTTVLAFIQPSIHTHHHPGRRYGRHAEREF